MLIFLAAYIIFSLLIGWLAKNTCYRSMLGWTVLAFLFSPLAALVFLFVAGPPMEAREQVEADMTKRQKAMGGGVELPKMETACKACGMVVNVVTREGVYSPEDETWRIICKNCDVPIDTEDVV